MDLLELKVLAYAKKNNSADENRISGRYSVPADDVIKAVHKLQAKGFLTEQKTITNPGIYEISAYKVDNAVIMAAGESRRCLPLSKILPKGLFTVKGEILIEREIRQLHEAGISQVIVVTGYMADQFEYLKEKYGVTLVMNEDYHTKNNVSSIYAARQYLGNSYICCADNYYTENIFSEYEFESFYTCEYTKDYADEYCITENSSGYIESIKRGGEEQWYTVGANFWTRDFSKTLAGLLTKEYGNPEIDKMLIDDYHIRHFSKLPVTAKKMKEGAVLEFDTLAEFEAFDPDFKTFAKEASADHLYGKYKGITRYAGVKTDNRYGRLHFNENLWGPSPNALIPFHKAVSEELYLYDSGETDALCLEIAEKYHFQYDHVFLHNSGSELVKSIITIMIGENDAVLLPLPHWSYYPGVIDYRFGHKYFYGFLEEGDKCYHNIADLMEKAQIHKPRMIIVTSPAMPSGNLISPGDLEMIVQNNPQALVYVDQAYFGFEHDPIDVSYFIRNYDNVMFARTFSKFYALAGLRLGYGIASKRALEALWLDLPLLRLPVIARKAAAECLRDDAYYEKIRREIRDVKDWFYGELLSMEHVHPYKSDTNFIYMKITGADAAMVREIMIRKGYLYRIFEYDQKQYYRINVAPMETMKDFMVNFKETMKEARKQAGEEVNR